MEPPCWCTTVVLQYDIQKSTQTSGIHLVIKGFIPFAHDLKYMCVNTSPNVLEMLRLLRFIGADIFFNTK